MSAGIAKSMLAFGENVFHGMTGNKSSYVKRVSQMALKSNMTRSQIKDGLKASISNKASSDLLEKKFASVMSKNVSSTVKNNALDKVIGNAAAKNDIGYRIGDAIGGGARDATKVFKSTGDIGKSLQAGFTKKGVDGRTANVGRIAGSYFGASVAGRVASGGGIYRDRYGRVNAPGIPFI